MNEQQLKGMAADFAAELSGGRNTLAIRFTVCNNIHQYLTAIGRETRFTTCYVMQGGEAVEHFVISLPDGRILDALADLWTAPNGEQPTGVYIGQQPEHYRPCRVREQQPKQEDDYYKRKVKGNN